MSKKATIEWPHRKDQDQKKAPSAGDKTIQEHVANSLLHISEEDRTAIAAAVLLASKNFDELYAALKHTHEGLFSAPSFRYNAATGELLISQETDNMPVSFKIENGYLIMVS